MSLRDLFYGKKEDNTETKEILAPFLDYSEAIGPIKKINFELPLAEISGESELEFLIKETQKALLSDLNRFGKKAEQLDSSKRIFLSALRCNILVAQVLVDIDGKTEIRFFKRNEEGIWSPKNSKKYPGETPLTKKGTPFLRTEDLFFLVED